jgi:hypothetical protein
LAATARARVIVSNWQIWLVAAIVSASSRSCSGQTAPAHRPTTSQTPVRGLDKGTMEMRTTSAGPVAFGQVTVVSFAVGAVAARSSVVG